MFLVDNIVNTANIILAFPSEKVFSDTSGTLKTRATAYSD